MRITKTGQIDRRASTAAAQAAAMTPEQRKERAAKAGAARWGRNAYLLDVESWDSIGPYNPETSGHSFAGYAKQSEQVAGYADAKRRRDTLLEEIRAAGRLGCVILRGPLPSMGGRCYPA